MALGWLELCFFGVLGLIVATASTRLGKDAAVTEYSFTHNAPISELPPSSLYTSSQPPLNNKLEQVTHISEKNDPEFRLEIEGKSSNKKKNNRTTDIMEVTVLPTSIFFENKMKKAYSEGKNITDDELYDDDQEVEGFPVAAALKTSGNGYTRSDGTYIVNDDDEYACVMAYFKSQATIYYPDSKGDFQKKVVSPAEESEVYGMCDRVGEVSEVSVKWGTFVLTLRFGLDDLTDSWFVSRFVLTYDLNDSMFPDSAPGMSTITVASKDGRKFWQTNNAYSFRCLLLHDIALADINNNTATLHFDEVRVQAFCNTNLFRRPKHCIHRVHRNEMVPVAVGGVLAGSTLLLVAGYGIFRYFTIKKVQYDTME